MTHEPAWNWQGSRIVPLPPSHGVTLMSETVPVEGHCLYLIFFAFSFFLECSSPSDAAFRVTLPVADEAAGLELELEVELDCADAEAVVMLALLVTLALLVMLGMKEV